VTRSAVGGKASQTSAPARSTLRCLEPERPFPYSHPDESAKEVIERGEHVSNGPMPSFLEPIARRLSGLKSWRDLQRLLAAYPDQDRGWQGHLWVRGTIPGRNALWEGIALEVVHYEADPNEDLPLTVLVRRADGQEHEFAVRQLQALAVVW
jgi:hypothetical protein